MPPTDPRYLNATIEEIILDYWAHAHLDDPKLREQDQTEDFEAQRDAMEAEMAEAATPVTLDQSVMDAIAKFKAGLEGPTKLEAATKAGPVTVTQTVTAGQPGENEDFETVADDHWR